MLEEFFSAFEDSNDPKLVSLWESESSEVQGRTKHELVFDHRKVILGHVEGQRPFLMIQHGIHHDKLYDHARYLVQEFVYWSIDQGQDKVRLDLIGTAYQAIVPLLKVPRLKIEDVYARGTIETRDRYDNLKEKEVSKLVAVEISIKDEGK